ncbi:hypothetical protein BGZ80_000520 [Entomortierella chlamydospora]|uniref:DBF4-type domain-containing protein n=1 Tax=Entomortierella chlamydospora TaxID=101097 RepID=A0A9P6SYY6_9FUNG|nr:hypothetical protein BGZ79_006338 [Entomortierella chlamydospora]KAG0011660.1 hypothetical protein BGZ80_000520 [Entomortierella chlamydospora]
MAEHALNQMPLQALQESKNQNIALNQPTPPGKYDVALTPHGSLINKLGQENVIPMVSSSSAYASQVNTIARKSGTVTQLTPSDKAFQRNRVALSNVSNNKPNYAPYHPTPHPTLKVKHQPLIPDAALPPVKNVKLGNSTLPKPMLDNTTAQTQTQHQSQSQNQSNDLVYGSQEWIHGLVQSLPKYKFFFDGIDPNITAKLRKTLLIYGAVRLNELFSCSEVTHVVTTRSIPSKDVIAQIKAANIRNQAQPQASSTPTALPVSNAAHMPPGKLLPKTTGVAPAPSKDSIVFKALSFGIHVWSLERVTRLLAPLMVEPIAPADNRNLQELLRREKLYGLTTNQNDEALKVDYHVFKGAYLLVEDITGYHRPILAQEYELSKCTTIRSPWPRIYLQRTDKSPFTHHKERSRHVSKHTEKNKEIKEEAGESKTANDNTQVNPLGFSLQGSPSALVSGINQSVNSNVISTNSTVGKVPVTHGLQHGQDRVLEQLGKRILSATKIEAGVAPDSKKSEFVRPTDVIKVIKPNVTHEFASTKKDTTVIANATAVGQPTYSNTAVPPGPAQTPATNGVSTQGASATLAAAVATVVAEAPIANTSKVYLKQGYCENCHQLYVDFNKHIDTSEHRKYAQDSTKFERLDRLLLQVQRKPKNPPVALELDTTIQNTIECEQQPVLEACVAGVEAATDSATASTINPSENLLDSIPVLTVNQQEHESSTVVDAKTIPECRAQLNSRNTPQPKDPQQEAISDTNAGVPMEDGGVEILAVGNATQEVVAQPAEKKVEDVEHEDEVNKELSSELSRLDVSETGEEENEEKEEMGEEVPPLNPTTAEQPIQLQEVGSTADIGFGPRPKATLDSQPQVPFSDGAFASEANANQLETEATQPDGQFLDGSPVDSHVTDPVAPIHLTISQSDSYSDGAGTSPTIVEDHFGTEGSSEEDRDGSDDAVALLKSPSAGRGVYARIQSTNMANMGRSPAVLRPHLSPPRESFKRKLESAMAEDQLMEGPRSTRTNALEPPNALRPIIYDDNLRSILLSQQARQQHSSLWDSASQIHQHQTSQSAPLSSFPLQLEAQQIAPQSPAQAHQPKHSIPSSCTEDISVSRPWNGEAYGPQTQPHLQPQQQKQQKQQSYLGGSENTGNQNKQHNYQRQYLNTPGQSNRSTLSHLPPVYQQQRQYYPPQSPTDPNYSSYGSGYGSSSSPSRSPSQRYRAQQFPVMTHAEQERERCYHHYRGNQLPEPAGQKKMRSSTSLEDAFEEYGEGCMVFIE